MKTELVTGDDNRVPVRVVLDGQLVNIDAGATVRASVVYDDLDIEIGPVTCDNAALGADWPNGIVLVEFPAALSETLLVGDAIIEIEVNDGGKLQTYFVRHVTVYRGRID